MGEGGGWRVEGGTRRAAGQENQSEESMMYRGQWCVPATETRLEAQQLGGKGDLK